MHLFYSIIVLPVPQATQAGLDFPGADDVRTGRQSPKNSKPYRRGDKSADRRFTLNFTSTMLNKIIR